MTFVFDNSPVMWSMLTQAGSYATAMIYGAMRREHTRVWPILALGAILDIAAEVWFASSSQEGPGLYVGFFLYPLYCTVATVAGIVVRVAGEYLFHLGGSKKSAPTDGTIPRFPVS
jgi:hypothetical protein